MDMVTTICAAIFGTCIGFTVRSLCVKKKSKHAPNANTSQSYHSAMRKLLKGQVDCEISWIRDRFGGQASLCRDVRIAYRLVQNASYDLSTNRVKGAYDALILASEHFDSAMQDKLLEEEERVSIPHNSCLRIAGQVKSKLFEKGV